MKCLFRLAICFAAAQFVQAVPSPEQAITERSDIDSLKKSLSSGASISFNSTRDPRWSDYMAPVPIAVVNVASAQDVSLTVRIHAV